MTRQYYIILALILSGGILLVIFGRSGPTVPGNASTRTTEALKAGQVPIIVITEGLDDSSREFVSGLREIIKATNRKQTRLITLDTTSVLEKDALMHFPPAPGEIRVVVLGLNGEPLYVATGSYETEQLKSAIAEGLTKPRLKFPAPGEHSHSH
jgi:hypothetical protein